MLALSLAMGAFALSPAASAVGGTNTIETAEAKAASAALASEAYGDFVMTFDRTGLKPNSYVWNAKGAKGPVRVVISLERQMAFAYMGDRLVGAASVSTATEGRVTPQGIFPIWLKKPIHYSQKYDNAPMPYMQMIDQYGIALHAGHNPGYPASHGCVRLPLQFAKNLYALTDIGTEVWIGA